jgi:hypothetical protein
MPDWGRIGLAGATFGMSEVGGLRPAWQKISGQDMFDFGPGETDPAKARYGDQDYIRNQTQGGIDEILYGRQAPQADRTQLGQAAQLDPSQQAQFRRQQMQQAQRLGAIASGQQQGAGEIAAQRQANRSIAQQQAMARMGRGQAGASRMAARNVADIGVGAAGQSQVAAMQDQQAATGQLGQLLAQGREADIGMAGQNAQFQQQRTMQQGGMDQQRMLANVDMQLRARGMDDQARIAYLAQLAQMNQAEMNARMQQEATAAGIPSQGSQVMQAAGPMIAAGAMMSDERAKEDIKDGGSDVDEMLDLLKPATYRYKDGAPKEYTGNMGDGRRIAGIMAQALEKSKAGRSVVVDTPKGKVLDNVGALSATLAGLARLNQRLRAVEGKKG